MSNTLEEKRTQWQRHIENWRHSGLSQKSFCEKYKLKPHQFWYWNRQFNSLERSSSGMSNKNNAIAGAAFVPIQLSTGSPSSLSPSLELPNGIHIHGITHIPTAHLKDLVKELS